ncbi:DNase I-like protein [Jimgerdemannia flammicorona]|uniref:DNase I-like protein n=1 Tax=Jimgerdemannia flammicorona TaxID=994334 RepID=A0A433Q738_9FUNG|nr:DNase I-like protein [Jimgerdemannia flammicorona]
MITPHNTMPLSVLSFNCWGLRFVSKSREDRLHAIADYLATTTHDIVGLQELWMSEDVDYLRATTKHVFPHLKYYYSGVLGSGLAILSRHPIVSTYFHRYTLNGHPLEILHGDYYVGKGVASACIEHPMAGVVEVFNTHLHADYNITADTHFGHRLSQAWELANLVRASAGQGRHIIVLGDYNSSPTTLTYALLTTHAVLSDAWLDSHPAPSPETILSFTPQDALVHLGSTCDTPLNSWTNPRLPRGQLGDRLDYILYRTSPRGITQGDTNFITLRCTSAALACVERDPHLGCHLSDHFGVEARFEIIPASDSNTPSTPSSALTALLTIFLETLRRHHDLSKTRSYHLTLHFLFALPTSLGLWIATTFVSTVYPSLSPPAIGAIVGVGGLLSLLGAVWAVVALVCGFVAGHEEDRAFREVIEEVEVCVGKNGGRMEGSDSEGAVEEEGDSEGAAEEGLGVGTR